MAPKADPLETYNKKRDFTKTAEPPGQLEWGKGNGFMVQKHDATRLHYDLRLELDGVLKSWAVPNGPSLDPADKRLAIKTEDHPLSYATFEGTIPKGEYGGGTVMLWDRGTWTPKSGKDPHKGLEEGHLHFFLNGERMKGEWILFRLKPRPKERQEAWILRKIDDEYAGSSTGLTDKYLTSIKTGRTMQEIAAGKITDELANWKIDGPTKSPLTSRKKAKSHAPPKFREPQKATLADHVPSGSEWIHELKYDGYRCLLAIGGNDVRLYTRSGLDWSKKFPEIIKAARELNVSSALLDGEIVKVDENGSTSFSALQRLISEGGHGLTLFVFDVLELNGKDLARLSNIDRKERVASAIGDGKPPFILYSQHVVGHGERLFDAACAAGGEGIISKKGGAPYRSGRTKNWLKIKCIKRQEFVIIGWVSSESNSRTLRSLLLGLHEDGKLQYAGKVGTGFSAKVLRDLQEKLRELGTSSPPVAVPREVARGAHWVKPQLVAEVAFAEFTSSGVIRHASFLGLRADKPAHEVIREIPQPVSTPTGDSIKISHPSRIIFPEAGITKGELVAYYRATGQLMQIWTAHRPLSLVRCPQGRAKKCFFQKHNTGSFGPHVRQIPIEEKQGKVEDYVYVEDVAGIIACVQMGTIEFHGWGSKVSDVEKPDRLVFDIDPDIGLDFSHVKKAALDIRRHLADMGLQTFPMLTGGKGMHVVVPLTPMAQWPQVKDFARRFSIALATAEPDRFTAHLTKIHRKGRMFLDYLRNQRGATAIIPYSARARQGAPVAAPINWNEINEYQSSVAFTVRDSEQLLNRASSHLLQSWGFADQVLPNL